MKSKIVEFALMVIYVGLEKKDADNVRHMKPEIVERVIMTYPGLERKVDDVRHMKSKS